MNLDGTTTVHLAVDELWARLSDPAVLVAALPGCVSLTPAGDHRYDVVVAAGVGGAAGTYRGTARVVEVVRPDRCRLTLDVAGEPGTVRAEVTLLLAAASADPAATTVHYDVVADVAGRVRAVGGRVVEGSLRRTLETWLQGLVDPPDAAPGAAPAGAMPTGAGRADAVPAGAGRAGATAAVTTRVVDVAGDADDGGSARRGGMIAAAVLGAATIAAIGMLRRARARSRRGGSRWATGGGGS